MHILVGAQSNDRETYFQRQLDGIYLKVLETKSDFMISNALNHITSKITSYIPYKYKNSQNNVECSKICLEAEDAIFEHCCKKLKREFVKIESLDGEQNDTYIRTVSHTPSQKTRNSSTAVLFVHGFCSGIGLWALNFQSIIDNCPYPFYAIDLPGFGLSSRCSIKRDTVKETEDNFVQLLENWRAAVNITDFIMVGHSFGGYIIFNYALKYPERVRYLVFADPWGFEKVVGDEEINAISNGNMNGSYNANARMPQFNNRPEFPPYLLLFVRMIYPLIKNKDIFTIIRTLGSTLGIIVIRSTRKDLILPFADHHAIEAKAETYIPRYIYGLNEQQRATGEDAFYFLAHKRFYGWSKNPVSSRSHLLDKSIKVKLVYGEKSWISSEGGYQFIENRQKDTTNEIHIISDIGHHIYSQAHEKFNKHVLDVIHTCANET